MNPTPTATTTAETAAVKGVMAVDSLGSVRPWSSDQWARVLAESDTVVKVAWCDDFVVGFVVRRSDRIIRCVVHPQFRRVGVCRSLLRSLPRPLYTTLRETNTAALAAAKALGWRAVGVERGRFRDGAEVVDGVTLELKS